MKTIIEKLIQNASEFRYMYFGIILTLCIILAYKFCINAKKYIQSNESSKNKIKKIIKDKYLIIFIIVLIPIMLEIVLYKNYRILFSGDVYIRLIYEYGIFLLIALYKVLCKKIKIINKVLDFIVKHRFKIALIIFVILVACKVNFSSIDMWNYYIRENVGSTIFGKSRSIRSDEWLITTPFNLSQSHVNFSRVNENLNIGNNDMNIFHAPVLDFSIIVRVYNWGYILLGNEYGLSWAWCLKLISMLLIFFELGMILTKKNKLLSILVAIWITFSPAIMWWSMIDTIAFAAAIVVLFHNFVANKENSLKKKILIAYGMLVFLCNFAFALYPAWQIPLAYFMLVFIIIDFIKYRKNLVKKDYLIMIITLIVTGVFLGYFVATSWDGIQAMMNTKYPGGREELGGDYDFNRLINYYTNFFTPYTGEYENPSDLGSFIFPAIANVVVLVLVLINILRRKDRKKKIIEILKNKENWYLFGISIILTIFALWLAFKWPRFLAKITGLFMSPTKRLALIAGFVCVIFTILLSIKIFNREKKLINNKIAIAISLIISIITYFVAKNCVYSENFSVFKLSVLIPAIFFMNYTFLSCNKKAFVYVMIIISLYVGGYVNPVTIGTKSITDTRIAQAAVKISNENPDAIWIGQGQLNSQYLVANGIKVLNGINEYPNYDWIEKIDSEHKYEEVWNRYAHIIINLDYDTYFELKLTDAYVVHMTYQNLKDLNIKYYYTNEKPDRKIMEDFSLEPVYEDDSAIHYIYQIN